MGRLRFIIDSLHSLIAGNSRAIQTPSLQTDIRKWFLLAQGLLVEQVVSCSYVVVPVGFDTLY